MVVEAQLSKAVRTMLARMKSEKMTQAEFAGILGRSESWLRKMAAGTREPSYETLDRFVHRFEVDPRELFDGWGFED